MLESHVINRTHRDFIMSAPTPKTIKRLFAYSGNKCAFPGCNVELVTADGTVLGEICHINARNAQGPRYDSNQSDKERHGFDNLILLCQNHHKIVDDKPDIYDADSLREIKSIHENLMRRNEIDQDSFYARILLNNLKKITINNSGNVMVNSPGRTQVTNVNVSNRKSKVIVAPPTNSIGDDVNYSGYILRTPKNFFCL